MGTYRLDARAEWRNGGKDVQKQENIPLLEAVTGAGGTGTSSESATRLEDVKAVFDRASGAGAITFVLVWPYAHKFFPNGRGLDLLSIGVYDKSGRMVGTATGKDLKVIRLAPEGNKGKAVIDLHDSDGFSFARS